MEQLSKHDLAFCLRRAPRQVLEVLKEYPRTVCIAGGYIRSVIANEEVNDIDIFTSSPLYSDLVAQKLVSGSDRNGARVHKTDNAFSVLNAYKIMPQVIHRWTFDDVMNVLPSFDFTIACAAIFWDKNFGWSSACDPEFYRDLAAKRLVYRSPIRNEDAGGSLLRVLKFYQRGYRIPLDSLGAVIARMMKDVEVDKVQNRDGKRFDESQLSKVLTGFLHEVDPNLDPNHIAHLPTPKEVAETIADTTTV